MYLFTDEKGNKLEIKEFNSKTPADEALNYSRKLQQKYKYIVIAWCLMGSFNYPIN